MKVVAIIQARMGSSRLPGKMLMTLGNKPAFLHVVDHVRDCKTVNEIVLATTDTLLDNGLARLVEEKGILVFRGSENDVLDRYYQAAKQSNGDVIVRITGDCPLIDSSVIDSVVEVFLQSGGKYDYVSNIHPPTFPDGLDVEVFSFGALEKAWEEAELSSEREHVTPYIWKHPEIFSAFNVSNDIDLSTERWTLDTQEDLDFLHLVIQEKGERKLSWTEIKHIIDEHPEWRDINAHYHRNEGYEKSIAEETKKSSE